jgi:hypothetical protein
MLIEICYICQREGVQTCGNCDSLKVEVGVVKILWNGYLAKEVEVCWCQKCDCVWLRMGGDDRRKFICAECCQRALEVPSEKQGRANSAAA